MEKTVVSYLANFDIYRGGEIFLSSWRYQLRTEDNDSAAVLEAVELTRELNDDKSGRRKYILIEVIREEVRTITSAISINLSV